MKQPICLTETTIHHLLALITMNLQRKKKNVWACKLNNNLLKKVLMLIFTWTFFPWIKCQVAFAIKVLWRLARILNLFLEILRFSYKVDRRILAENKSTSELASWNHVKTIGPNQCWRKTTNENLGMGGIQIVNVFDAKTRQKNF